MTYSEREDRSNPEPWKTNYVRESYAREKHPDDEAIIELRRKDFDDWLERHDRAVVALHQGKPSEEQASQYLRDRENFEAGYRAAMRATEAEA